MPALLKFTILVSFLSASFYCTNPASIKHKMSADESIKQLNPSRIVMGDFLSGFDSPDLSTRDFLSLGLLRSLKQKKQQTRHVEKIKRNVYMKNEINGSTNSTTWARLNELKNKTNGSDIEGSGFFPNKTERSTTCHQPIVRRDASNPCVKRVIKTYHTNRNEIITEYECLKASFYCPQTLSGLGRCEPIKVHHAALGKILTVGCKCKP